MMNRYLRAALLGAVSGMRSTAAPLAAQWAKHGHPPVGNAVAFVGEAVADKLPFVPSRLQAGPLVGRAGAAIYGVRRFNGTPASPVKDAVAVVSALASAFAFSRLRGYAAKQGPKTAFAAAFAEDAICLALIATLVATR